MDRTVKDLIGLSPVIEDENSVAPHFDVIREALKFKASSILATDSERQQAQDLLDNIYKEVPPADPEARRPPPWE